MAVSKTARRSSPQTGKQTFKRSPGVTLIIPYGQGRFARIAQADSPAYPQYEVGSDEFYAALGTLIDAGYETAIETQLTDLGWGEHLEALRASAVEDETEVAEAA